MFLPAGLHNRLRKTRGDDLLWIRSRIRRAHDAARRFDLEVAQHVNAMLFQCEIGEILHRECVRAFLPIFARISQHESARETPQATAQRARGEVEAKSRTGPGAESSQS